MMSALTTLHKVAQLLPSEERERFLAMIASFKNVPEDDEYLMILEAIGFMTLIWNQVPEEVSNILDGVNPITETRQELSKCVHKAVQEAVPSHQDLRQIVQSLEEHKLSLKQAIGSTHSSKSHFSSSLTVSLAFLLGICSCFIAIYFFYSK